MWGIAPVKGTFREIRGGGEVSATGEVTGTLEVAAASIDTSNSRRDKQLRSVDFLDSDNHHAITFGLEGVQPFAYGVLVTGTLTLRGRGRPLSFEAAVSVPSEGEVWLDAEVRVDRAEFGLTWSGLGASMLNTLFVHAVFCRR